MAFIFALHLLSVFLHPIHVSVSEVEIDANEITWNARIYKDDLLIGLYGTDINMAMLDNQEKVKKDILSYFSKNVTLLHDGTKVKWVLKDLQPDPEAIWITVTTKYSTSTSITIQNRLLFDVYNDQKNVVNISWATGKKNIVFEKGEQKKVIKF